MHYLRQTTAMLLSPTKKGWERKCLHSLSSETASESQQPQSQMSFPFPLRLTKHSLESFCSAFPLFFPPHFCNIRPHLGGGQGGKTLWKSFTFFFLKTPRGFPTFYQAAGEWFSLHPITPGTECKGKAAISPSPPPSLSAPIKINQPKFRLSFSLKAPSLSR